MALTPAEQHERRMERAAAAIRKRKLLAARVARMALTMQQTEIAEILGMARSTVSALITDPDGSKARRRKDSYRGQCVDCGAPTSGSNGRALAPARCVACAQGAPFEGLDRRRCVPVRLTEIPKERRLEAAFEACRIEQGDLERTEILLAALNPSDRVYWVAK